MNYLVNGERDYKWNRLSLVNMILFVSKYDAIWADLPTQFEAGTISSIAQALAAEAILDIRN